MDHPADMRHFLMEFQKLENVSKIGKRRNRIKKGNLLIWNTKSKCVLGFSNN